MHAECGVSASFSGPVLQRKTRFVECSRAGVETRVETRGVTVMERCRVGSLRVLERFSDMVRVRKHEFHIWKSFQNSQRPKEVSSLTDVYRNSSLWNDFKCGCFHSVSLTTALSCRCSNQISGSLSVALNEWGYCPSFWFWNGWFYVELWRFFGLGDNSDNSSDPELEIPETVCGGDNTDSNGACDESLSQIDFDPVGRWVFLFWSWLNFCCK